MTDTQYARREDETDAPRLKLEEEDQTPLTDQPDEEAKKRSPAPEREAGRPPLKVSTPRLRYASPGLERSEQLEGSKDRVANITRAALEVLGGSEDRALRSIPEDDVLKRLVNDEALDLTPRSDLTPLIPEEQSRSVAATGRDEGKANEEEYRREAELKPDDLDEIARERRDLVQAFYKEQGQNLIDPAEISQLAGEPQDQGQRAEARPAGEQLGETEVAPSTQQLLSTEGGERALKVVTERLSTGFHDWLKQDGHWHKRSEWLKKHLTRSWELAADTLNPNLLLVAPKDHGRLAGYVKAEEPDPELQDEKLSEKERTGKKDAAKTRTKQAAKSGTFERQIREARLAAVMAITKTIAKNWAEARDPDWHLDATQDDPSAALKSPQNQALDAWVGQSS